MLDSKKMGHNVRGWKNFNVYDAFTENNFPEVWLAFVGIAGRGLKI